MSNAAEELVIEALQPSEDERLEVASELIASVDGPADADWDEIWTAWRFEPSRGRRTSAPASFACSRRGVLPRFLDHNLLQKHKNRIYFKMSRMTGEGQVGVRVLPALLAGRTLVVVLVLMRYLSDAFLPLPATG